ncbi:MAG: diguanylate cyclase [Pseudomonadota bacterium]
MQSRPTHARFGPISLLLAAATLCAMPAMGLDRDLQSSQWIERHWNSRNGLPSETVWEVHQDGDGYLWIATDIGLLRFDGLDFHLFNGEAVEAFRSNDVRSLDEASDGTLWVGTYGGGVLRRRNGRFERFDESQGLVSPVVFSVRVDGEDNVWAGTTSGVCRMRQSEAVFQCWTPEDGVAEGRAARISVSEQGDVWVGSLDAGLTLFRDEQITVFDTDDGLNSAQIFFTHDDPDLGVFVGTYAGGLYSVDPSEGVTPLPRGGIPDDAVVLSATRDLDNTLWLGINQGGLRSYPDGRLIRTNSFDNPHPFGISVDRDGALWAATTVGLFQFRDGDFTPWGAPEGLANSTFVLAENPKTKAVWVGTEGKGLYRIAPNGDIAHFTTEQGLPANSVSALWMDDDGTLWVGTFGGGIAIMREGTVEDIINADDGLASNQIAVVFRDLDDVVWIGTPAGVNRLRAQEITHTLTIDDGLPTNFVRHIAQRGAGQLLLSTEEGIAFLAPDSIEVTRVLDVDSGLDNEVIGATYVDDRGIVWIGNRNGGLSRLDGDTLFQFKPEHGVSARSVMAITEDLEGNLWLAGRAGISRIDRAELDAVARSEQTHVSYQRRFRESDGLRSPKVFGGFQPPMLRASDGRVWIATNRGATVVEPSQLRTPDTHLSVVIEAVRADDRPIPLTDPIRIPAGARGVEIDYTVPRLNDADQMRFRYRLHSGSNRWQNAGVRRTAFFTSLPPRARTFEVQATWEDRIDGFMEATSTPLALYVEPTWHQSRWFQGLLLVLLPALLFLGYRIALSDQRRRQRSLQRLVDQRTSELRSALETVEQMSRRDPLTQVANRRHFEERLREEWARTVRHRLPLSVMMLDIDYFKQYNDSAGHLEGDDCLRAVAGALAEHVRHHDFVARYGGEEFIVLLPDTSGEQARVVAERLLVGIRALALPHPGRPDAIGVVTASGGFATAEPGHVDHPEELIKRADEALYLAKRQGRDRVVFDRDPKRQTA